ncbi:unnamed protein product [Oppiella nova]|uniref:Uncharacterized protein n=1 Tax=Oppiella nova TaxID=334625 RepID=A0A7R9QEQ4_9ACAR|nr:unnamed protein product [Oppiella nova]CAG2164311.1 unnamed protein product [Oppiella nova]
MFKNHDFEGKVVLITGSSSGIGAEAVVEFAKRGARVVITGRNGEALAAVAEQCRSVSPKGSTPLQVVADISKPNDCKRLIETTVEAFGKLDILVNNAGSGGMTSINNANIIQKYEYFMDTNLRSALYLSHLSVDHLAKTRGNIINISSLVATRPVAKSPMYAMSKSAMDMLTNCMALELAPMGIRVNIISPGVVRSNFGLAAGLSREQYEAIQQKSIQSMPLRRVGEPLDIANAILFMASDECTYLTASRLASDGGGH